MSTPRLTRRRHAGRVFAVILGVVLVVFVALFAWVGIRGLMAQSHLDAARNEASGLPALVASDPAAAADAAREISAETSAARELTSDVGWRAASTLPWVGPQLAAVSTLAASADDVATKALDPLVQVASTLDLAAFAPVDGAISTAPFVEMRDAAALASAGTRAAADSVAAIDLGSLLGALRTPTSDASELLGTVADATEALANASVLLPRMLGSDGPRDYLVIVQNNAEWRSLGGNPGAMVLIHTDGGAMTLTEQDSSTGFPILSRSIMPLDEGLLAVTGESPGRWFQNVTEATDFSVAARLAKEFWTQKHGGELDGVISIDPVALSYLLAATGPVTLPTGQVLTSENAAQQLLNQVYIDYPPEMHDAFFAGAASAVFEAVSSGAAQPGPLLEALARAGGEGRLLIWSAHDDDQAVLDGTTLQGGLPVTDSSTTGFGVYVNDGTGSKMDYYARLDTSVAWCGAGADGNALAALTVTISNDATEAVADTAWYIHGDGIFGVPPGTARTVAYIYLPEGATVAGSRASESRSIGTAMHDGREVLIWTVDLPPGTSATFDVAVTTPLTDELTVTRTPTLNGAATQDVGDSCAAI